MRCRYCKSKFEPKFFRDKACQKEECRDKFVKDTLEKARKKQKSEEKRKKVEENKKHRIEKVNVRKLSEWKNILQPLINQIARLIDYGQPCISTGNYTGKMNAGHCISVGSNNTLRFNLHNIHLQSEHSNSFKGGDNIKYKEGIERVYGKEYLEFINNLQSTESINLSILDIKEIIPRVKKIIQELKELEKIYEPKERIFLRNKYNELIGIYKTKFNVVKKICNDINIAR